MYRRICPRCNTELAEGSVICPNCMWQLNMTQQMPPHYLQMYTMLANKYQIIGVIGEGKSSITYLAQDVINRMWVAVKEFFPKGYVTRDSNRSSLVSICEGKNPQSMEMQKARFMNEAGILKQLVSNTGVVGFREYITVNNTAYIVTEYLGGDSLKEYIEKNGYTRPNDAHHGLGKRIPVDQAKKLLAPVMAALANMHARNIIHGDLNPDHLRFDTTGHLKILDFCEAKQIHTEGTIKKGVILSQGYAPLEQHMASGNLGSYTDVYAVSAVLYKCITGMTPVGSIDRSMKDTLVKPSEMGIEISSNDEKVLMQGLAISIEDRPENMREFYNRFFNPSQTSNRSRPFKALQKSKQLRLPVILGAFGAVAAVLVIGMLFAGIVGSLNDGKMSASKKIVSVLDSGEEDDLLEVLEDYEDNEEYEELILEILELEKEDLSKKQIKAVEELLMQAIEEQLAVCYREIDRFMEEEDYLSAYETLEDERVYRELLMKEPELAEHINNQILDDKEAQMRQQYIQHVTSEAVSYANHGDESGVVSVLTEAGGFVSGEEYEKLAARVYSNLVMNSIHQKIRNGESTESILTYIEENMTVTGNNCWVTEYWDYFYVIYCRDNNISLWETNVNHISENGYILENSATQELTTDNISHLSRYELQLARFEIYARHGRGFNDPSVTKHFSKYGWYQTTTAPESFDESVLSDIERKNKDTILAYETEKGYRSHQ